MMKIFIKAERKRESDEWESMLKYDINQIQESIKIFGKSTIWIPSETGDSWEFEMTEFKVEEEE